MSSSSRKKSSAPSATGARQRSATPPNPETHAQKIAEAAEAAWHGAHGSGRLDVPLAVVATVAALPQRDSQGRDTAEVMRDWDVQGFLDYARHTWSAIVRQRPDVVHLLWPLITWIFDDKEEGVHPHAHAVAQAVLRAGQTDLTGTERRFHADLLGNVLMVLRPKSALQARGQFYTPPDIAKLLACMTDVQEHGRLLEPMMGTGGMFRAVAEVMRDAGRDPRTMEWVGCDIDEIAVACATVNSMIWGLGTNILFCAGNAFAEDWEGAARAQRDELRRIAAGIHRDKIMIRILKSI